MPVSRASVQVQPSCCGKPRGTRQTCRQTAPERHQSEAPANNRRTTILSIAGTILAAPACATTSTSPYEDAKTMQYGLDDARSDFVKHAYRCGDGCHRVIMQPYSDKLQFAEGFGLVQGPSTRTVLVPEVLVRCCQCNTWVQTVLPDVDRSTHAYLSCTDVQPSVESYRA